MKIFEDRERAIEAEWALRAEHATRVRARRNRLFAEWAAAEAGLTGDAAAEQARIYVKLDFEPNGETAMLEAVAEDLGRPRDAVRAELTRCGSRAEAEIGS